MGVEIIESNFDDMVELDDSEMRRISRSEKGLDARRKLENRIAELKLQRDILEFDFDDLD